MEWCFLSYYPGSAPVHAIANPLLAKQMIQLNNHPEFSEKKEKLSVTLKLLIMVFFLWLF